MLFVYLFVLLLTARLALSSGNDFETISGQVSLNTRFNWHYGYDIEFRGNRIHIRSAINLVPGNGVKKIDLERVKPEWNKGIQDIWSGKFNIRTPEGLLIPIMVEADFKGPDFHHDVIVRSGGGCCSNELKWYIMDSPVMIAHEFGHMLGLYDEYGKGALNPVTRLIDSSSIMTSRPVHAKSYPRHFDRILDWYRKRVASDLPVLQAAE